MRKIRLAGRRAYRLPPKTEPSAPAQPADRPSKNEERNYRLALVASLAAVAASTISPLATWLTTNIQIDASREQSQIEFLHNERQRVYSKFIASVDRFSNRVWSVKDDVVYGDFPVSADSAVYAGAVKELQPLYDGIGQDYAALKLIGSDETLQAAYEVYSSAGDMYSNFFCGIAGQECIAGVGAPKSADDYMKILNKDILSLNTYSEKWLLGARNDLELNKGARFDGHPEDGIQANVG